MRHRRVHRAVRSTPVGNKVVATRPAGAGNALKMREDSARMVVGRPGAGGLIVNIATLETQAGWRVAAGDLVAPDAVGSRAERARIVVRRIGACIDRVDKGIAGCQPR